MSKAKTEDYTEIEEEIAGILSAISIVSKRLAVKLRTIRQDDSTEEGGEKTNGENV